MVLCLSYSSLLLSIIYDQHFMSGFYVSQLTIPLDYPPVFSRYEWYSFFVCGSSARIKLPLSVVFRVSCFLLSLLYEFYIVLSILFWNFFYFVLNCLILIYFLYYLFIFIQFSNIPSHIQSSSVFWFYDSISKVEMNSIIQQKKKLPEDRHLDKIPVAISKQLF